MFITIVYVFDIYIPGVPKKRNMFDRLTMHLVHQKWSMMAHFKGDELT